jgi:hypothetical protein
LVWLHFDPAGPDGAQITGDVPAAHVETVRLACARATDLIRADWARRVGRRISGDQVPLELARVADRLLDAVAARGLPVCVTCGGPPPAWPGEDAPCSG